MNLNIGHQHPKVINALKEQAEKLCYSHPAMATEPRGRLGEILAHYISYHGATHGAIALTGDNRRWPVEPTMPGVVHVLNPYC